jgi:PPK2 family polyphosphate:nucleotide phosphotransferase
MVDSVKLPKAVVEELRVQPGRPAGLAARNTLETKANWLQATDGSIPKDLAEKHLEGFKAELGQSQGLLYADAGWALLIVIQALDAGGKDGTIKHVMSGINPQGCRVVAFKEPSAEELRHDFLWRCVRVLPERGQIGVFNRSYYEEVLVPRVHPALLEAQHLPTRGKHLWQERYESINTFERHLDRNGTRVVKLFLHISKEEQRRRFLARLEDRAKQWKLTPADIAERDFFDDYQLAYEEALTATSTPWAPWFVVPADHKARLRALVAGIVVHELDQLDLRPPTVSKEKLEELAQARETLQNQA